MGSDAVHFLPLYGSTIGSGRAEGLAFAEARSHAAKVSHARARTGKKAARYGPGAAFCSSRSTDSSRRSSLVSNTNATEQWRSTPISPSFGITANGLDPFLLVADDLSALDGYKLNAYLRKYSQSTSPAHKGVGFCPIRDIILPKLAVSAAMVQCLMLISDLAAGADSRSIYQRRVTICRRLRALAQDRAVFEQHSTVMTLATAIVAEYRSGNVGAAQCHGKALQNWFITRGGFKAMTDLKLTNQVGLLIIFTFFDITIFQCRNDLERALARFRLPVGREVPWLANFVFAAGEGPQIALLHVLNMLLAHSNTIPLFTVEYGIFDKTRIAPGALILMTVQAFCRAMPEGIPGFCALETIEFVQLLSFATRATRTAIVRSLSGVLCGRSPERFDLNKIKAEIVEGWSKSTSRMCTNYSSLEFENLSSFQYRDYSTGPPWTLDFSIDTSCCPFSGRSTMRKLRCPMRIG